ncbi:MAG: hypothetical protein AAF234_01585 [Pseudomonadota bacterium]
MATFEVSKIYEVPVARQKSGGREIELARLKLVADEDAELKTLLESKGVYVFTLKAGKGRKPWYVGKSERSTLLKEGFNSRNILSLNSLINSRKGTLEVSFVTELRKRGKPNLREIGEIEYMLIGAAAERNHDLLNKHHVAGDTFKIRNIYNSGAGKRSNQQAAFADIFGM